jgi:PAS domain S-box-containing protein
MNSQKDKILIVEDDAGLLELLCDKIQESDYDVFCAISAEIAFNWLKVNQPTLMLLDYNLQDMNGSEFIDELAKRNLSVPPFILATGQGDERIAVKMMKLGARDYIVKDTNYLEFIPIVVSKVCKEIEIENKLKLAEEEINRIGKHYQTIIEKSPDGFILLNNSGEFKYISPSALRMFGYDEFEISTFQPNDLTHPDDLQMVLENLAKIFKVVDFVPVIEYRFKHKNGDWIWIESTFSNLLNDPNVGGILINFRNISERKQTEKTLKIRETFLTSIVENLPGLIWLKDTDSNFLLTNTAFAKVCGKEKSEYLVGKSDLDVWPKHLAEKYLHDDQKVIEGKTSLHDEELIFDQNREKWFETFKTPILEEKGLVIGTTGYSRDITERKLSELELSKSQKEFADLFEQAPVGYQQYDTTGRIIRVNQTELKMLGYTKEEMLNMFVWEVNKYPDVTKQIVLDKLLGKIQSSEPFERIFRKKDGSLIHVMIQDVFLYDEQNKIAGIRSTIQDISNLKEAEDKIKKREILHRTILETALSGFLILDKSGNIKEVNQSYSNMSGFSIPELLKMNISDFETIELNSHIDNILNLGLTRFESKHKRRDNSTYDVDISVQYKSTEEELIVLFVRDITERKKQINSINENSKILNKLLLDSSKLIDSNAKNVDFEYFANSILEISGAKYASFNLFEPNGKTFRSVAFSGLKNYIDLSKKYLGFNFHDKKWNDDLFRAEKIKNNTITKFDSLRDLIGSTLPTTISLLVEKAFNLGDAYTLIVSKDENIKGNFTLLFEKNKILKNREILEIYAGQIGLFLSQLNANRNLMESERKYKILFADNPQPMIVYDWDTLKIMEVNQTAEIFYGYNREEFIRMSIDELHPKAEKSLIIDLISKTKLGAHTDGIYNHVKKNGQLVFVEVNAVSAPIFGPNARHVLIDDVTERIMVEEKVQKSVSLLNATIESTADGILVVDLDGKATLFNQKFIKMWNIPEELLTSSFDNRFLEYAIPQMADPDKFLQRVTELYRNPELTSVDRIDFSDGRSFDRFSIPQKIGEAVVGRVWSFRDITERLIAEEKLAESERFFRQSQEAAKIGSYDLNLVTEMWTSSNVLDDIFGINEKYNRSIQAWLDLVYSDDREMLEDYFENYVLGQRKRFNKEYRILRKADGKVIWVLGLGELIIENDRILSMVGTIQDITERKLMEEQLKVKMDEMTRFHNLTVDRELRMVELKSEINELLKKTGKEEKYVIVG